MGDLTTERTLLWNGIFVIPADIACDLDLCVSFEWQANGEDSDEDEYDEVEETALESYETPLDKEDCPVDEYAIFKNLIQSEYYIFIKLAKHICVQVDAVLVVVDHIHDQTITWPTCLTRPVFKIGTWKVLRINILMICNITHLLFTIKKTNHVAIG